MLVQMLQKGAWRTAPLWKPQMVCQLHGHCVVQAIHKLENVLREPDGVIIAVQNPFVVA